MPLDSTPKIISCKNLVLALLLPLFTCCVGPKPAKQSTASLDGRAEESVDSSFTTRNVVVSRKGHSLRLDILDGKAQAFIRAKDKSFPQTDKLSLRLSIDTDHPNRMVTLDYDQGVGKRCWSVTFDSRGEIKELNSAVMQLD